MQVKDSINATFARIKEQQRAKYLGLPMVIGRSKREVFSYITEAIAKKVSNWKNHFLTSAGKEVLLKSVIHAVPIYAMSCFKLTGDIGKAIETLSSKLWWDSTGDEVKKIHWQSWQKMAREKEEGGLGFKSIQEFNMALLAKQLWRLITQPNLLMSKIMKSKYFSQGGLLNAEANEHSSWL